ncbi:uncharacterized protein LOC128670040 [Plodia interpunctella]|uniref:uncharacterized protein LOC128670040 n=1 Tax=Plodia interpunctella TaxID=58824 RepID=UPI00236828B1|nr:uncharacterized protein LOC128670040 [Plodia interpunctella]
MYAREGAGARGRARCRAASPTRSVFCASAGSRPLRAYICRLTMEEFIDEVRAQACIWNPMNQDYRDTHVRDAAWQYIVQRCNNPNIPDVRAAKTEWKKLRDNHREALKRAKLGQNKLLPAQITTWKYAKVMQFLEPHMKYRITENIDMDPIQSQDSNATKSEDVSTTEAAHRENRKRRCDCDYGPKRSPSPKKTDDALEAFFNSIVRSTRDMPPWMQTRVKKKIFAVIIEEEEFLSSQNHRRDNTHNFKEQCNSPIIKHVKTEVYSDDSFDAEAT